MKHRRNLYHTPLWVPLWIFLWISLWILLWIAHALAGPVWQFYRICMDSETLLESPLESPLESDGCTGYRKHIPYCKPDRPGSHMQTKCPSLIWPLHLDSSQVIIAPEVRIEQKCIMPSERESSNFNLPFSLVLVIILLKKRPQNAPLFLGRSKARISRLSPAWYPKL